MMSNGTTLVYSGEIRAMLQDFYPVSTALEFTFE